MIKELAEYENIHGNVFDNSFRDENGEYVRNLCGSAIIYKRNTKTYFRAKAHGKKGDPDFRITKNGISFYTHKVNSAEKKKLGQLDIEKIKFPQNIKEWSETFQKFYSWLKKRPENDYHLCYDSDYASRYNPIYKVFYDEIFPNKDETYIHLTPKRRIMSWHGDDFDAEYIVYEFSELEDLLAIEVARRLNWKGYFAKDVLNVINDILGI